MIQYDTFIILKNDLVAATPSSSHAVTLQALLDSQIAAQKQETEAAMATLREASREMEAIQFEKRHGTKRFSLTVGRPPKFLL